MASLFAKGSLFVCKPILMKYLFEPAENNKGQLQAAFSVPKKKFKHAVDRNRIKRQMRNVYRLLLPELKSLYAKKDHNLYLIFVYNSTEMLDYNVIEKALTQCTTQIKMS